MSGKRLYDAYNAGGDPLTANKNYQGLPCPKWEELPDNIRAKWSAADDADKGAFGWALRRMKEGHRLARREWEEARLSVKLQGSNDGKDPYITWVGASGNLFEWSPRHLDLLAEDWYVL